MSDIVRVRLVIETGYPGCEHEDEATFSREDWDAMDEEQRNSACYECVRQLINDRIDGWWELIDE